MKIWLIVMIVVVLIILYIGMTYNALTRLRNKVKTNWSQIDVVLKRRADLIPNLVETVKGYAKHEKETLDDVIKARNTYVSASLPEDQMKASGELTQALSKLMMLSEAYPDLKANTNFIQLQNELRETEDKITFARQFYNDSVYAYQNKIEMFPSNLIAGMFGFKDFAFFEVEEADKKVPEVKF
ncbi:LemA family protein [Candidatus Stoquefichus massiliensis]|uniref:LemA family protein n=1 Tax=Candidatus Stoquefichus massiliensis TaxID=1470350 RepID=UPI000489830C|nr:LemA family protein [Candidatus Stoquefichus massiliensis]